MTDAGIVGISVGAELTGVVAGATGAAIGTELTDVAVVGTRVAVIGAEETAVFVVVELL